MALSPVLITLSTKVLSIKGNTEIVSSTFIAKFLDGSEKWLNRTDKMPVGLRKEDDCGEVTLSKENCTLYWRDWSKNPSIGKWATDYPVSLLPLEITSLFSKKSILA